MMTMRRMPFNPFTFTMPTARVVDDLLESIFDRTSTPGMNAEGRNEAEVFVPAVNVWEDENALHVECELPGFEINDIEITGVKNRVTLTGTRRLAVADGENTPKVLFRERVGERFNRSIDLPVQVDFDQAQAHLEHGVLRVTLPKVQQAKARRIKVRSA